MRPCDEPVLQVSSVNGQTRHKYFHDHQKFFKILTRTSIHQSRLLGMRQPHPELPDRYGCVLWRRRFPLLRRYALLAVPSRKRVDIRIRVSRDHHQLPLSRSSRLQTRHNGISVCFCKNSLFHHLFTCDAAF